MPKVTQLQIAGLGFKPKFLKSFFYLRTHCLNLCAPLKHVFWKERLQVTVSNSQGREEKDHAVRSVSADSL